MIAKNNVFTRVINVQDRLKNLYTTQELNFGKSKTAVGRINMLPTDFTVNVKPSEEVAIEEITESYAYEEFVFYICLPNFLFLSLQVLLAVLINSFASAACMTEFGLALQKSI